MESKAFVSLGRAVVNFSFFNGELKLAKVAPVLSHMKLMKILNFEVEEVWRDFCVFCSV